MKPDFRSNRLHQGLAAIYAGIWIITAIDPFDRFDWFLENLLVFGLAIYLVASYHRHPLSNLSYILITLFMSLHAMGAHYTYSEIPIGNWLKEAFAMERNHYDRVIHFAFGLLLAIPLHERVVAWAKKEDFGTYFFSFTLVILCSAIYEAMEWVVAEIVSPDAALAYLGTQGDVFDAQKDSVLAALGALIALGVLGARAFRR